MAINDIRDIEPGQLYTKDGNDVWEVKSYFTVPSVTLKNIRTGEETTGGVPCLNFKSFKRLLPEPGQGTPAEKEIEMPGGFPLGTKLVEVVGDEYPYKVVIPGEKCTYRGKTMEDALQVARDRGQQVVDLGLDKSLPLGTRQIRCQNGGFDVIVPTATGESVHHGETLGEAKRKAVLWHNDQ